MASPEKYQPDRSAKSEWEAQPKSHFVEMLENKWNKGKFVCVGLDSDYLKIPELVRKKHQNPGKAILDFNMEIIDATVGTAGAYKPNTAFYEAYGSDGVYALERTIKFIKERDKDMPVILDVKRADIGNSNEGYARFAFDICEADAITVHPYLGMEAMKPFLDRKDKGVIVLCKTSNIGSDEFQNLEVKNDDFVQPVPVYAQVAMNVADNWNYNGNCGLVVGATYPEEMRVVRSLQDLPILIPGIGAQGGDLESTLRFAQDTNKAGMIINSSRGIIFASNGKDFAEAAREETQKLHNQIVFNLALI